MADAIYPKGIRLFDPHPKAPGFIKGSVMITLNELIQFCKDNPEYLTDYNGQKQLKLQLLEKKQGGFMLTVDTYKKESRPTVEDNEPLPF